MGVSVKQIEFLLSFKVANPKAPRQMAKDVKALGEASKSTGHAVQGLTAAQGKANYALLNTTRLVSDMPFLFFDWRLGVMAISNNIDPLVASLGALNREAKGFKGTLKALKDSMNGAAGIGLFISFANALFLVVTQLTRTKKSADNAKKAIDDLTTAMNSYFQISDPSERLKFGIRDKGEIKEYLKQLEFLRDPFGVRGSKGFGTFDKFFMSSNIIKPLEEAQEATKQYVAQNKELIKTWDAMYKFFEKKLIGIEAYEKLIDATSHLDKVRKNLPNLANTLPNTLPDDVMPDYIITPNIKDLAPMPKIKIPMDVEFVLSPKEIKKFSKEAKTVMSGLANGLQAIFSDVWQSIFGEANSLLEKFLQNFADGLFRVISQQLAERAFGGLLSLLSGGALGGIGVAISDFFNRQSITSGGGIKIYLDGRELSQATAVYLPEQINTLQRRRLL